MKKEFSKRYFSVNTRVLHVPTRVVLGNPDEELTLRVHFQHISPNNGPIVLLFSSASQMSENCNRIENKQRRSTVISTWNDRDPFGQLFCDWTWRCTVNFELYKNIPGGLCKQREIQEGYTASSLPCQKEK